MHSLSLLSHLGVFRHNETMSWSLMTEIDEVYEWMKSRESETQWISSRSNICIWICIWWCSQKMWSRKLNNVYKNYQYKVTNDRKFTRKSQRELKGYQLTTYWWCYWLKLCLSIFRWLPFQLRMVLEHSVLVGLPRFKLLWRSSVTSDGSLSLLSGT